MDIYKRIAITLLLLSFKGQASEFSSELQKHLVRPLANIIEEYVYDGTITLNPEYSINTLRWSDFGLHYTQFDQLHRILNHQYAAEASRALESLGMNRDSTNIVTQYLTTSYHDQDIREQIEYASII